MKKGLWPIFVKNINKICLFAPSLFLKMDFYINNAVKVNSITKIREIKNKYFSFLRVVKKIQKILITSAFNGSRGINYNGDGEKEGYTVKFDRFANENED